MEIGVDIEKVSRFEGRTLENDKHFLTTIFTDSELEYSFSDKKSAQHLCARYCGKEAVIKSLSNQENLNIHYKDIEILNDSNGAPYINISKYADFKFKISLSHTSEYAVAFVVKI